VDIRSAIEKLDFFGTLSKEERDDLVTISSLKHYPRNYLLYYEKSHTNQLLFLVRGLARAYKIDKHDNEIFLYYIYPNHLLSDLSTIEENQLLSYANMVLVEESTVLSIDYAKLKKNFLDKGLLCLAMANEVIRQSKQLQSLVNREFIFDAVAKVAMMLSTDLSMFNRLKRYDVSGMLHIQPSTLSRVLSRLKRQRLIDIDHGTVIIINGRGLRSIYEGRENA
jgi:CRP/FNR family transcriptional regulator